MLALTVALVMSPGWAGDGDPVALQVARIDAALAVEDPEAALQEAAVALANHPEDWRTWWGWREVLKHLGAEEQLQREAESLVVQSDPWRNWVGGAWIAAEDGRLPTVLDDEPGSRLFVASLALEQGRAREALVLLAELDGPGALGLRLAAFHFLGEERKALAAARTLDGQWPERIELLTPVCTLNTRGSAPLRKALVARAAEDLGGDEVLEVYRAHALLAGCREPELALGAAARLLALGEPHALGGRQPSSPAMIRDLGRVLAMQKEPALPQGGSAAESQRVLVATARELQERGRVQESLVVWRQAMAMQTPPPGLALEAAEVELSRGETERAQALIQQARQSLSLAAVDPGEQGHHALLLAQCWRLEALERWGRGLLPDALEAAALAATTAGRPEDLVLWGELLEQAGEPRAALQAYSRAVAIGASGLDERLKRLYDGPAQPGVLVEAWRQELEVDSRGRAVEEARGARVPPRTLSTTAGPLRIGEAGGPWLVLNFWASWCGPCQRELPELAELAEAIDGEGLPVRIVAVSMDDRRTDYEHWIAQRETSGLILAWDPDLGRVLRLRSIPTTLLVSPEGLVQETRRGYRPGDAEQMLAELRPHLEAATEE